MKKILFIASFPIVGLLLFCLGYLYHKPKTITITVREAVKVYDFSQEPRAMEIYANMMGKTLENKEDIEEYKHKIWREGYQEGYRTGFLSK